MALSNNKRDGGPLVFLSPRSVTTVDGKEVELNPPHFEVSRVNEEGKIVKTKETPSKVSGNLVKIDFKEREWKGVKSNHVVLYLSDPEVKETYCIDLHHNIASRSLFNSLLSLTSAIGVGISVYRSKKGYMNYGVEQKGETVRWKFELKDLPVPDVIKDKKGTVVKTDYAETDRFMEEHLRALSASLLGGGSQDTSSKPVESKAAPAVEASQPDSDIPF